MAAITEGKIGGKMIEPSMNKTRSGIKGIGSAGASTGNLIHDRFNPNVKNSNILGAEELSNGKFAIHKDKKSIQDQGLVGVSYDNENKSHVFTYDPSVMNDANRQRLNDIQANFKSDPTGSRESGVRSVGVGQDGKVRVEASAPYLTAMGIEGMYSTGNRFVEQKGVNQGRDTKIVPEIFREPNKSGSNTQR